ncbi:hypothetical protein PMAYCL1PPCAC_04900, partial [Pristionchus mayeri]
TTYKQLLNMPFHRCSLLISVLRANFNNLVYNIFEPMEKIHMRVIFLLALLALIGLSTAVLFNDAAFDGIEQLRSKRQVDCNPRCG